jgi:hypothetical protein
MGDRVARLYESQLGAIAEMLDTAGVPENLQGGGGGEVPRVRWLIEQWLEGKLELRRLRQELAEAQEPEVES